MRAILLAAALLASASYAQETRPGRKWTTVERLSDAHLEAVHAARAGFVASRQELPPRGVFEDYRAILHVHAEDSAHTGGTRAEVLAAAKRTGVRVILFADHRGPKPDTWRGVRDGVLFVPGSETGDGFLETDFAAGKLRFLCHVEERYDAPTAALNGIEIYNRHTDATDEAGFDTYFKAAMKDPVEWKRLGAALARYPDEIFGAEADYWPAIFAKWDRDTQVHHLTGIAANDAHHNQVYEGLDFDPYEVSFRNVSTHILARALTEQDIRDALVQGRAYVSHDWLADPSGFAFQSTSNLGVFDMGDRMPFTGTARLSAQFPVAAKIRLFHNGKLVEERAATRLDYTARETGAYRVEAWLTVDGEERPWIYSNPIYLEKPSPDALRLPSSEISEDVEVRRDISYTGGAPEDEGKHKLDLYLPKGKRNFPVFFFVHGGAWRSGDRSLYTALGNRFAAEGIAVVAPSYRLAPKNPHPAQIEDVAAAYAWVLRNIESYGGDRVRIYIGGHSAGGHLVALLALDERYLQKYGFTHRDIQGVVAMSGVYAIEGLENVFGNDQRQASPQSYIKAGAPRFAVTYCQWDYPTLPLQARHFHEALVKAGVSSELVYVPGESHISEIVHVTNAGDVTAATILKMSGSPVSPR
jgi:acetyl esterase/lipase